MYKPGEVLLVGLPELTYAIELDVIRLLDSIRNIQEI